MSRILLLATGAGLTTRISSIPNHQVASIDRAQFDGIAELDGLGGLLGMDAEYVPDVVIFGEGIPLGETLSIAQTLDSAFPDVELILVAEPDTELVLRAMRAGIRDVVTPRIGEDELKVLLHRASGNVTNRLKTREQAASPEPADRSRLIVVASPKGGVGKSMIAANMSVGLAQKAPMQVVLVDLDLQFGDAATILNLKPKHTLADAFGSTAALDTLILKTFLTVHPAGFYVLCGPESPTVSDNVSAAQIRHLLVQLSTQFRYVVVDTGAGLSEPTLAALEEANEVVLVSSMDVASIRALRKEIDVLAELDLLPESRHVALNFADRRSGLGVRDVEAVIGLPVHVVIPRSQDVPIAGNRGEPLMLKKRGGPVSKAVRGLIDRILLDEAKEKKSTHKGVEVA